MCQKFRSRILDGQLIREGWEIFKAKNRISSIELFDHMVNCITRGEKEV